MIAKIAIGIRREYLSYRHFSWRILFILGGEQFLRRGYSEGVVKVFFWFSRFLSTLTGKGWGVGGLTRSWS